MMNMYYSLPHFAYLISYSNVPRCSYNPFCLGFSIHYAYLFVIHVAFYIQDNTQHLGIWLCSWHLCPAGLAIFPVMMLTKPL